MTPEMSVKLKRSLIAHEGYRKFIYTDTVGKLTGGIGYNFSDRGLSDEWINQQYEEDVNYFYNKLCEFPWFKELNDDRQIVLCDMSFMGWKRFLEFHELIKALDRHDYEKAYEEMINSKWAEEVKGRAQTLANAMLAGSYAI